MLLQDNKQEKETTTELHFSTENLAFLEHHVLHNEREIALIIDVVMESSSLFEKRKIWGFGDHLRGCGLQKLDRKHDTG